MKALISAAVRLLLWNIKTSSLSPIPSGKVSGLIRNRDGGNRNTEFERRKTEGLFEERKEETDILGEVRIFRFDQVSDTWENLMLFKT